MNPPEMPTNAPAAGPLRVSFRISLRDAVAFSFYHIAHAPVFLVTFGVGVILFSVTIWCALPVEASAFAKIIAFIVMLVPTVVLFAGLFAVGVVLTMVSKKNKTFLTEHTVDLREDSFLIETPYGRYESKWAIVQKLRRTSNYIFVYVSQHSGLVIPRRAFQTPEQWDAFYGFCKRKFGEASARPV